MASYYAKYWTTDPNRPMLGGVYKSQSSRFSHKEDAQARLDAAIAVHQTLFMALIVEGEIKESKRLPEIIRHCEGAEAQAVGCRCPKCGATVWAKE